MGWMQKLCSVYDSCSDAVGLYGEDGTVLLPIFHTLLTAPITVTVSPDGGLLGVSVAEDKAGTIAPCTEKSLSRTGSTPCAHLLSDSLMYVAGDLSDYMEADTRAYFDQYLAQLSAWCGSPYGNEKLRAVRAYLGKGTLTADLIRHRALFTGEDGLLLEKWNGPRELQPPIFSAKGQEFAKTNVRFCVDGPSILEARLWMDSAMWESAQRYCASKGGEPELCYISGARQAPIRNHPKKIIRRQANAKLISAKDTNLKYRGRFLDDQQALSVGAETSFRAHYALSWLADSRGIACGDQTILAFGEGGQPLPDPLLGDTEAMFAAAKPPAADALLHANSSTLYAYMEQLNLAVRGFRFRTLENDTPTVVMALEQSTTGRLAITYYQEMTCRAYTDHILRWHKTCSWRHSFFADGRLRSCVSAPSHSRIVDAAYGRGASTPDKLRKNTYLALMNCVFGGRPVPRELVSLAVYRASNPLGLQSKEKDSLHEWNGTLEAACALYRKQHEKEDLPMSLDRTRTDRSYLFGRLLAAADQLERYALGGENRPTNALRLMTAFSQHPVRVWKQIDQNILPYKMKLGDKANYYVNLITEIMSLFSAEDFDPAHDRPLDGLYLLGYHSQRQEFLDFMKAAKKETEEKTHATEEQN